ncbi:MAG: thioredoxin [Gammaproteobacteria bacterium RIFCSPHIGHO2_12_FULL_37_14]|nr:MAG: thioredoxin [Gammaproteobacteria bacterium RIFCSPHIGHO2_12_FULL_37_14]
MSSQVHAISDASFETDVIESKLPVVVDFWAQWCGPCKALTPIIEEVALKYTDKVKFVKLNVDQNPTIPPKFGVRGIPTLILFQDGQVKATQVGLLSKVDLIQFIDSHTG